MPQRTRGSTARPLVCALVGAVAAVVAVIGPAHHDRTFVERAPAGGAFEPVLVAAHRPQSLRAVVPCVYASRDGAPAEVLGTTRDVAVAERLSLRAGAGTVVAVLGTDEVVRVDVRAPTAAPCEVVLEIEARDLGAATWTLRSSSAPEDGATAEAPPPVVSGFAAGERAGEVRASLATFDASSHPSARQWFAVVVAVLATLAAALALARGDGRASSGRRRARPWGRADAVVVAVTVAWWLAGPWFFDDGWLMATVRARAGSGSFSNYFDTLGSQMPLGFGHHVLLWPFAAFGAPFVWWRLVPVLSTLATWVVLRRIHARLAGVDADLVALAAAHLVFVVAWTMTLRPEPMVALLAAVALDATLRHRDTGRPAALATAATAAGVAMTLHPSGVVAAAPLVLAVAPLVARLRRDRGAWLGLVTAAAIAGTATTLLLFADSDLARWRRDRGAFAGDGFHSRGVLDELDRYRDLLANGTVAQLASVLLTAVALAALLVEARRRSAHAARDVVLVVVVAVGLLALTPSKWTYHFGSLAAFAAVCVALQATRAPGTRTRTFVALGTALAAARAFRHPRDAQYFIELGARAPALLGRSWPWLLVAVALLVVAHRRPALARRSVTAALAVVVATSLVVDAARPVLDGPAWALGRAGLADAVRGGCPFADDVEVSDLDAAATLAPQPDDGTRYPVLPPGAAPADLVVVVRGADGAAGGTLRTAWVDTAGRTVTGTERTIGVPSFRGSVYGPAPASRPVRVARGVERVRPGAAFVVVVEGDALAVERVAVAPTVSLSSLLAGRRALVSPPELPLLRCAPPPRLHAGIAEVPDVVIGFERRDAVDEIPELDSPTGPWAYADDAVATSRRVGWLTDADAFTVVLLHR